MDLHAKVLTEGEQAHTMRIDKREGYDMSVITIDLVTYDVTVENGGACVVIHDCAGSILSELDTSKGSRFAQDHQYAQLPSGQWVAVEYDADTETCTFSSCNKKPIDIDDIVEWVYNHYDAIESIGWEVLEK